MGPDPGPRSSYFAGSWDTKQPFELTEGRNSEVSKFGFNSTLEWKLTLFECCCINRILFKCCNLARDVSAESPPVRGLVWGMGAPSSSPALVWFGEELFISDYSESGKMWVWTLRAYWFLGKILGNKIMEKSVHLFSATFWMKTNSIECFIFSEMKFHSEQLFGVT